MAEILYRKWRPRSFAELAGQEHVATTLRNALATGRVAHAYLFSGPRGTGKTSTGRVLGKALNCTDRRDGEPCNACESCLSFLAGRAMDLIELDAASNRGIDEIRSLRDKVAFVPGAGEYKVYLIDEVHMLTEQAFNALLKTLEEPPPHVVFILATTETHKLPATIASRCQRFDFRRIPLAAAVATMQRICDAEGISCEPEALEQIARSGTGSLRDSINLLDQLSTSYGKELSLEHVRAGLGLIGDERSLRLARMVLAGDLSGGLELLGSVRDDGLDLRQFQREMIDELRALLLMKSGVEPPGGMTAERRRELASAVSGVETATLLTALKAFGEADLKADPNSTLPLDIALAECVLARTVSARPGPGTDATESVKPAPAPRPIAEPPVPTRPTQRIEAFPAPEAQVPPEVMTTKAPAPEPPPWKSVDPYLAPPEPEASPAPTPAPVPERAVTSGAASGAASLRDNLREVYNRARSRSQALAALLISGCDIISIDGSRVVLGFRYRNLADKVSERAHLDVLTAIMSDVAQTGVEVVCRHEESVADWRQRETANRSPLVRAAQEMGARVLSAERRDPPEELA